MRISVEFEPVLEFAAVEQHLRRADRDAQHEKAEEIERAGAVDPRLGQKRRHAEEADDADRHVDVEHPAPVVFVGEIAAERRAQDRAQHDARAPDRHRLRVFLARIDVEQHGLGQRYQRRAEHALQQAVKHHLRDVVGEAAQRRGQGEARDRDQEQPLAAVMQGEPAAQRRRHRGGDDVGGQHPGDLVLRHRQAALHVGQRDIGDGRVQRLHDGRQHDRDRDEAAIGDHIPRFRRRIHCLSDEFAGAGVTFCSSAAGGGAGLGFCCSGFVVCCSAAGADAGAGLRQPEMRE